MSEFVWGPLMATYLFLGGLAGGAYLISALVDLFKGEDYEVLSKSGALVSTVAVIASVVVLLLEIKRFEVAPLSFLNAFRQFPGSMISVGTWLLTSLLVVSVVTVILAFFGGNWLVRKIVDVVGIILSLGTAAYTGLVLSYCRGIPFWGSPFLPALFTVSGILTGLTMAMLMIPVAAYIMPKALNSFWELYERKASYVGMIGQTEKYCQVLTVVEIALLALYMGTTPTTGILLGGSSVSLLFYVYIALGLLLPLGIGYLNSKWEHQGKDMMIVLSAMIGQVMVLLGGFILRYVVLIGGQLIH
jgi:formate-dependent nitrite reductase membrane component NrfD